ncbi:hypothetical protein ABW20_dc0110243 [Dactylellina cionopaga]|nr:hypothetical protein ABW20_dc0110243 [Dactylellina cionopaga]
MCMNIGIIIGPVLGGIFANPIEAHPGLFGPGSWLGGEDGVGWMKEYPYALPNLVSAAFLCFSLLLAAFGLEETNPSGDIFGEMLSKVYNFWNRIKIFFSRLLGRREQYEPLQQDENTLPSHTSNSQSPPPTTRKAVPWKEALTPAVTLCLICFTILPLHNSTFLQLFPIFLSTPRHDNSHPATPISFTGGLGLPAAQVGYCLGALGAIGIAMQIFIYPPLQSRLGTLWTYQASLLLYPVAYLLAPFLAMLPSTEEDINKPAAGAVVWIGIIAASCIQVTARTFASPGNVILLINSVENRKALGTVNGLGSSVSSLSRAVGPFTAGWGYGVALEKGVVGAVWWVMALVAMSGWFVSTHITEGKGFAQKEEEEEAAKDPPQVGGRDGRE